MCTRVWTQRSNLAASPPPGSMDTYVCSSMPGCACVHIHGQTAVASPCANRLMYAPEAGRLVNSTCRWAGTAPGDRRPVAPRPRARTDAREPRHGSALRVEARRQLAGRAVSGDGRPRLHDGTPWAWARGGSTAPRPQGTPAAGPGLVRAPAHRRGEPFGWPPIVGPPRWAGAGAAT